MDDADLYDIAAAYAFSISEGQPFVDENKRTGLNAALLFLELNGAALPAGHDACVEGIETSAIWYGLGARCEAGRA